MERPGHEPVKITDSLEIRRLLYRASSECVKAQLAHDRGDVSYETQVLERDIDKAGIALKLPEKLRYRRETKTGFLVVLFLRGTRAIAFNSRELPAPLNADPRKELYLALPRRLFVIQRRSEHRIEISRAYDLMLELPSPGAGGTRIRRRLHDISSKGLSFVVGAGNELSRYPVGGFVRGVTFRIHARELMFDLQVRNRIPLTGSDEVPRYKIGCRFLRITEEDREFLVALSVTQLASFILK